jgi:uncharacterized protein
MFCRKSDDYRTKVKKGNNIIMKMKIRITALLLSLVMLTISLCGCANLGTPVMEIEGTEITENLLLRTEMSENYLRTLGFTDFRIRLMGDAARLQLKESQFDLLFKRRCEIYDTLHRYYSAVLLDLEVRDE